MEETTLSSKTERLPEFFRPLFWSYNFDYIDPDKDIKTIVLNVINYGYWKHWHWLVYHYGIDVIRNILTHFLSTELRPPAEKLARVVFNLKSLNNASRSTNQDR
mgnify:FL=1